MRVIMDKEAVIQKIHEAGVVAVIRAGSADEALKIAAACVKGGIGAIELTFTVPNAERAIVTLINEYSHAGVLVGAGTVMDAPTARIAMLAGAQFIVSPYFDEETVKLCNRYALVVMPGVMTVTEAVRALDAGADILKIFPAELFGPKIIKAIKGPLPYARMVPTGGIDSGNAAEWIRAGAFAVGAGSSLTGGVQDEITRTAKLFIDNIRKARI